MAKWIHAGHVDEFRKQKKVNHRRKELCLYKLEDGIYCTDNSCSHEYSPLHEGMIVGGDVYCPKHGSRFEIRTGKVKDFPATRPVKTYEVNVDEDGQIYIRV